jgi:hypothetical protein
MLRFSNNTEEKKGNHAEETQHVPFQIAPNIGGETENGKEWNKRIHWSQEELKEVLWCFMYIKGKL